LMRSTVEGGPSVVRSAGPADASDKAAARIQAAVQTTPDASCYDAKDHTTMTARGNAGKAETPRAVPKFCARALNPSA
jgi:hypothetical protein